MSHRNACPEHFHRAVEHALRLALQGWSPGALGVMARSAAARGLTDAADGYTHARLRLLVAFSS